MHLGETSQYSAPRCHRDAQIIMLKILHVVSSVDPSLGGVAESIVRRGEKLVEMGHKVEVVSLDRPSSPAIQSYPLPLHALGPGKTAWCYSPRLIPWLRDNFHRFDAVVIDGLWQFHGVATREALKGTNVPYFLFPHGMLDPWFKTTYPLKHLKKWLFWPWAEYRVLRDARAVLFTCEEERNLAAKSFWLYHVNPIVVPFGTSMPPSNCGELRKQYLHTFPQLAQRRTLLFLGRIHPKKGCDLLIEAFAQVANQNPDVDLVIAGPGEPALISKLQGRVATLSLNSRVHWLGMLHGPMKWGALSASAAFILPSHQENFGIAVAEALGCGLPVLISDKVNIWKEVLAGGAGFVGPDTVEGTVKQITDWLNLTASELRELPAKAHATYERHFTIDAMASGLIRVIDNPQGQTHNE